MTNKPYLDLPDTVIDIVCSRCGVTLGFFDEKDATDEAIMNMNWRKPEGEWLCETCSDVGFDDNYPKAMEESK